MIEDLYTNRRSRICASALTQPMRYSSHLFTSSFSFVVQTMIQSFNCRDDGVSGYRLRSARVQK